MKLCGHTCSEIGRLSNRLFDLFKVFKKSKCFTYKIPNWCITYLSTNHPTNGFVRICKNGLAANITPTARELDVPIFWSLMSIVPFCNVCNRSSWRNSGIPSICRIMSGRTGSNDYKNTLIRSNITYNF